MKQEYSVTLSSVKIYMKVCGKVQTCSDVKSLKLMNSSYFSPNNVFSINFLNISPLGLAHVFLNVRLRWDLKRNLRFLMCLEML